MISTLNGVLFGMLLFLMASGLTLIFSMMGVLNFAHASFYMLGAFFGFQLSQWLGFWPAFVIAPLLAFDACGWRLGYGGGFYDRTLRELRQRKAPIAVGVAYDQQAVDAVPHLDYDERLEWVLTPSGAIKCIGA